jgi:hypothetical protein
MDTHSYKGWLNSDNFFKRAFGIFFYYFFANLVFGCFFAIILFIFLMIGAALNIKNPTTEMMKPTMEYPTNIQNFK